MVVVTDYMHGWLLLEEVIFDSNADSAFQVMQSPNARATTPVHKFYVLPQMGFWSSGYPLYIYTQTRAGSAADRGRFDQRVQWTDTCKIGVSTICASCGRKKTR
jgi:hypothetical protein